MNRRHHDVLSNTNNIPLHCNICPKKPDFSDVSHLLTHVASKGHLSNYYKMKVKAGTDPASQRLVDDYDEWYGEWNLQDLMMERLSQKERKKGNGAANGIANTSGNSRRGSGAPSVAASSRSTPVPGLPGRRPQRLGGNLLDPQLGLMIKTEPKSRSGTPGTAFGLDAAALNRSYMPPMQSWPMTPYGQSPISHEPSVLGSLYSSPSSRSPEIEAPRRAAGRKTRRNLSGSTRSHAIDDDVHHDETVTDSTKLKGVYWEGMGMFDSATPDMRRRRNQKKATSVVHQLMATSEIVEPIELVFDVDLELRRERTITGNPESDDEGSPLKGESTPEPEYPPKKKAGRKPRQPLVEKDVNTNRVLRRRRESHHPPFGDRHRNEPYFDGLNEEDDELTYGRRRPSKRTGLSIHRDNSGPDITFDHPASLSTLTSSFRHPLETRVPQHHTQATYQNGYINRGHQRQPSFPFGAAGFRPANNAGTPLPPPNFGSFGQLNGQSMFQNANFLNNPFAMSNGNQAWAAFQQQFGFGQQSIGHDSGMFHAQGNNHSHGQNNSQWDIFNFGNHDMGLHTNADPGFPGNGDFTSGNPLFFSSAQPGPEDDEATVSPPSGQ